MDACIARIEAMTKEAEVGDRFTGKVVKTTVFGAFIELTKGTDGLLHISNVKPGERVGAVEDVLKQGDELDVTVVEVDRERGRIGLRLSSDPAVEGKAPEELSTVGTCISTSRSTSRHYSTACVAGRAHGRRASVSPRTHGARLGGTGMPLDAPETRCYAISTRVAAVCLAGGAAGAGLAGTLSCVSRRHRARRRMSATAR